MTPESLKNKLFGQMLNGKSVYLFTLQNSSGMKVQVTNYGARIVSAILPDRKGNFENVILGYNQFDHYRKGHQYLGATIGRVANRIGNAKFILDSKTYQLNKNLGNNHLHGGTVGFESLCWDINNEPDTTGVEFQITSPDGDQGYPGNLKVIVRYSLDDDNSIRIDFTASTDKPTIVNMTNHAYFNLNGKSDKIYKHRVNIPANNFLETDESSVPTGNLINVKGTPLDFRESKEIGDDINKPTGPLFNTKGYDHFFVIDSYKKGYLNLMAEIEEPESGRVLQVFSSLPGFQFYSSNFLDTLFPTHNNWVGGNHSAFCVEPSYFIDAPNHSNFQSIRLNVGEVYRETIVYKFLTR